MAHDFILHEYGLEIPIRVKFFIALHALARVNVECPDVIELNLPLLLFQTSLALPIIYHECVHLSMISKGLEYHDGTYEFEKELYEHHLPSTFLNPRVTSASKLVLPLIRHLKDY